MATPYYDYIRSVCYDARNWRSTNNHVPEMRYNGYEYDASKLIVSIAGDTIDLPFFGIDDYTLVIKNNLLPDSPKYNTVYYPLASNKYHTYGNPKIKDAYRSAASAIKAWFSVALTVEGLIPIKIGSTQYYGNNGILFNENKELLLLMTVTLQKVTEGGHIAYKIVRPNIYVDTRVFTEDNVLHKHIKQKLLPEAFHLKSVPFAHTVLRSSIITSENRNIEMDFKVIIDDLSYWITKPSVPKYTDTSEVINKWLADTMVMPKASPILES